MPKIYIYHVIKEYVSIMLYYVRNAVLCLNNASFYVEKVTKQT